MASPSPAGPATDLTIKVKASAQTPAKTSTLTCDPPAGTVRDPAAACAALSRATDPFAPVPKGQQCTMIYGGPEEATVTGTWKGKRVDARFNRKNGCELSRWTGLDPVLGKLQPVR